MHLCLVEKETKTHNTKKANVRMMIKQKKEWNPRKHIYEKGSNNKSHKNVRTLHEPD